jgi:sugar O-acyltransferase (sialic acid O-acetyltransferase NeuD family)
MKPHVIVIGAGGHAKVVADALLAQGRSVMGFTDLDASKHGQRICGLPVLGDDRFLQAQDPAEIELALGLGGAGSTGDDQRRRNRYSQLQAQGWRFTQVQHPSALVSPFARVGLATQLLAQCVVQAGAYIGLGCIVNTGAVVEHDTQISDWCHLAPRSLVCGDVQIFEGCHVGAGAVVRQGLQLGQGTVIGAGAVVVRSSEGGKLLLGVPAREKWSRP